MSKEKETEEIINDKLNSREFAFDEKAWAGMETLLDAQEKKRRFGFWWFFSASMFVVLIAGAVYYYQQSIVRSPQSAVSEDNTTVLEANTPMSKANTTVSEVNTAISEVKTTISEINTPVSKSNTSILKSKTVVSEANIAKSKPSSVISKAKTTSLNPITTISESNATVMKPNTTVLEENTTILEESTSMSEPNTIILEPNTTESEVNPIVSEVNTVELGGNTTMSESITSDSAQTQAEIFNNPLTAPGKETKNAWGVIAGVSAWLPYHSNLGAINYNGMVGFTGGVYYQRVLSKRIELGLSAVYSSRGALNCDKTIINSEFGFGIESDKTTISPQTLHYLNIPLYIRFNITQRSHLLAGASYYQLLATTSKIIYTTENSFGEILSSNTEKQTGNHAGFRKNDIAAFVGYELTLFDRMNAGLQFSYGFFDITNNSYNNLKGNDHNISLQLQLKYDLVKH